MEQNSVGLVETQYYTFGSADELMTLESGQHLGPVTLAYETYGKPNYNRSNAILILHALSGDAHVAGYHSPDDRKPGWWNTMVGPGKAFDTNRYWVICSNIIGGCSGSTGPGSVNPATDAPYGLSFPIITIGDMVETQRRLIDHLGIDRLYAVAGGSLGGFQVLEWTFRYPERCRSAICIASSARLSVQGLAFNAVGRYAITSDPGWNGGAYHGDTGPRQGLAIARMIGHITYLSEPSMDSKFGRKLQNGDNYRYEFETDFAVESYLQYQGRSFTERFDANSYLYITKAMDYFDVARQHGSIGEAFSRITAKYLVISYSSDWLFPTVQSHEIVRAIVKSGHEVSFVEIDSPYGHDAFLVEHEKLGGIVAPFLGCVGDDSGDAPPCSTVEER